MLPTIGLSSTSTFSFLRTLSKQCYTGTKWSPEKSPQAVAESNQIINEDIINQALSSSHELARDPAYIRDVLQKAKNQAILKDVPASNQEFVLGLSLTEAAALLNVPLENSNLIQDLYDTAFSIKNLIYGNRIVFFAPLYVANFCVSSCKYCGYRGENLEIERTQLTDEEVKREVKVLEDMGHKRILMLTGESPVYTFDQFLGALKAASSVKSGKSGEIRRINVEIPPLFNIRYTKTQSSWMCWNFHCFSRNIPSGNL